MDGKFRGVVFDMDGVLCDSERFICEAACAMFADRHGVAVKESDFVPFVGTGENRYLGGVAEKYGIALDLEADKAYTYEAYLRLIRGRLGPLPGVKDFIGLCRSRQVKIAVATSADEVKMLGNLKEIGLPSSVFDACVNGLEVVKKKPDPSIFLLAMTRIGLKPDECLVVEDAPLGVKAAKAAGAACLGLRTSFTGEVLMAAGADWVAADLSDVPKELTDA